MTTTVTASADLAIVKTGPATVVAGGQVSYSLTVTDNGPSDAAAPLRGRHPARGRHLRVGDRDRLDLHQRRQRLGHLHPPDARHRHDRPRDHRRRHGAAPGRDASPTRPRVGVDHRDPTPANNTSTPSTTVTASADLSIVKTGPATVIAAGSVELHPRRWPTTARPTQPACRSPTLSRPASRSCPRPVPAGPAPTPATSRSPAPARPWRPARPRRRSPSSSPRPAQAGTLTNTATVTADDHRPDTRQQHLDDVDDGDGVGRPVASSRPGPPRWSPAAPSRTRWWSHDNGPSDAASLSVDRHPARRASPSSPRPGPAGPAPTPATSRSPAPARRWPPALPPRPSPSS